jgi:hypothetical protein
MKTIQIRDAKASFSALVAAAEKGRHPSFADVAIAALANACGFDSAHLQPQTL